MASCVESRTLAEEAQNEALKELLLQREGRPPSTQHPFPCDQFD